jgi:peptide methionine sulfoxide reductase MsrB
MTTKDYTLQTIRLELNIHQCYYHVQHYAQGRSVSSITQTYCVCIILVLQTSVCHIHKQLGSGLIICSKHSLVNTKQLNT